MQDSVRNDMIKTSWDLHHIVESHYLLDGAVQGDAQWLEKQRILLADMAIHLLQTAIKPGAMDLAKLKNNLHAILTISDPFLPHAELKKATEQLYADTSS